MKPFYFRFEPRDWLSICRKMTDNELANYLRDTVFGLLENNPTTEIGAKMYAEVKNYLEQSSSNGKKGAEIKRIKATLKPPLSHPEGCHIPETETETETETLKEKIIKKEKFEKPTIEEIENYCQLRGNGISAEKFYDHYEANGWVVGKSKMKNWQAAVRTWENNSRVPNHYPSGNNRLQAKETAKYSELEMIEQVEHARRNLNGKIIMAGMDLRLLEKVAKCNSLEKIQNLEKEIFGK